MLVGRRGKGDCDFCFGSGVVTTLVTRHSGTRTLTNVFCFHLFITNCSPLRVRAGGNMTGLEGDAELIMSVLVTCDADVM